MSTLLSLEGFHVRPLTMLGLSKSTLIHVFHPGHVSLLIHYFGGSYISFTLVGSLTKHALVLRIGLLKVIESAGVEWRSRRLFEFETHWWSAFVANIHQLILIVSIWHSIRFVVSLLLHVDRLFLLWRSDIVLRRDVEALYWLLLSGMT